MALEAEMRRKIAVSIVAVGVFITLIVGIGSTFNQSGLASTGGLALVGAIAAFVLVMAGIGIWLSRSS
ncbi:hypothetical protein E6P09_03960 [Haloferax mediterranei ATCC 33500]|uniref:Transporter n=1 Tax=Haloferax mediterranei (strain ATCC 33500 / DSM 1411 / JCM 8866 / NBRC 14739 / NCIMB 2177 / R-4) TaxID=523841 RepID=I3R103_HALMT|nr:hypothetical protein [Haloferax mediterranei]AFK17913.1 transporter [Haloferax mediterranei ATCC 33500]AHZ22663.1 transporter [Haloferax mediterranei ATCC 33500]EMA02812.1 transporter [Haloferax mediterranei ATCC 33500]MDX5988004.1 hypothetical protein [Haloferax mediterranei ATCC 33500]QCQ74469.1 hypothetical protein E6P09_03960 [Haloferax mediterranei ATCC 33500]